MSNNADNNFMFDPNLKTPATEESFQLAVVTAQLSAQALNKPNNNKIIPEQQISEYPHFGASEETDFTNFSVDLQNTREKIQSSVCYGRLASETLQNEDERALVFGRNDEDLISHNNYQSIMNSNYQKSYEHLLELNNSFTIRIESGKVKDSNVKLSLNKTEVPISTTGKHKSISEKSSRTRKETRESGSLILEQATEKAMRNVTGKMVTSSRIKQNSIFPLNSSFSSKQLKGNKREKISSPVSSRKERINKIIPSSTNSNIKQQSIKMKEVDANSSSSKTIIQVSSKTNKTKVTKEALKLSSNKVKIFKNKSASMNNSFNENFESSKSSKSCLETKKMIVNSQGAITEPVEGGLLEKYSNQLIGAIQKMNMRTFLTLRGIIKPNENILTCCQAFVKLFAGLSDAIPASFSIMENIEWENIKVLFNSPVKILKLISTLPVFIEYKKLPQRNINATISTLSKIPYELGDPQNEAFYQMYEYIVSAIEYYKYYKPQGVTLEEFNWDSIQAAPILRASTILQESSPVQTVEVIVRKTQENKKKASVVRCPESPSKQVGTSPNIQSKSPLRQTVKLTPPMKPIKPAITQDRPKTMTRASMSPLNESVSSRKSIQGSLKKVGLERSSSQKKSLLSTKTNLSFGTHEKMNRSSATPLRNSDNSVRNSYVHESFDMSQYFTQVTTEVDRDVGNNTRSLIMKTDSSETNLLLDDITQRKRESLNYKAKVGRLLADHERYVKKTLKTQEEEITRIEREHQINEHGRHADYEEQKKRSEIAYLRDLKTENVEAHRIAKERQNKIRQLKNYEEMIETTKHSNFIATQTEKRKIEKKKELWDQYKRKMGEKLAKKQKETEDIIVQKREALENKILKVEWKKKQAAQEQEKWKNNYSILSKLIGEAK